MIHLHELEKLLDDPRVLRGGYAEEDFIKTARLLFERQFLYAYERSTKRSYDLVNLCTSYFAKLAAAFGYELVDESTDFRMIGIVPTMEDGRRHLQKDETIVLLVLAFAYHDRLTSGDAADFGCVEIDLDSVADFYQSMASQSPPAIGRMKEILTRFRRNGLLDFDDQPEGVVAVTIRPSIMRVVGRDYLERLQHFGQGAEVANETDDLEDEGRGDVVNA